MTVIYRLETTSGIGVYRSDARDFIKFDESRHPAPCHDSLLMENLGGNRIRHYHFGFISIAQLRSWFYRDECLRIMNKHRVVMSVYEAEEVYIGNSQLVFNRKSAKLVSQNNLIDFFKLGV